MLPGKQDQYYEADHHQSDADGCPHFGEAAEAQFIIGGRMMGAVKVRPRRTALPCLELLPVQVHCFQQRFI